MSDREDELRKALGRDKEEEERNRWDFKDRRNWRFNLGKTRKARLGFWLLVIALLLFLITQLVIKPGIGG